MVRIVGLFLLFFLNIYSTLFSVVKERIDPDPSVYCAIVDY